MGNRIQKPTVGQTPAQPEVRRRGNGPAPQGPGALYVVKAGDSLSVIAHRFGPINSHDMAAGQRSHAPKSIPRN